MEFVLLCLLVGGLLYFLPSLVARRKRDFGAIFALNLLLGWTFVGWVVSLVWALAAESPYRWNPLPPAYALPQAWLCANCQSHLQRQDQFCPSCGKRVNWYAG
jgi:hypothetical protein